MGNNRASGSHAPGSGGIREGAGGRTGNGNAIGSHAAGAGGARANTGGARANTGGVRAGAGAPLGNTFHVCSSENHFLEG